MMIKTNMSQMKIVLSRVLEFLSGFITGVFYGFLWGLTFGALIKCGVDVDCIHGVFGRMLERLVLSLAADGILVEAALNLTLPGLIWPLYNMIIFAAGLSFSMIILLSFGILFRSRTLLIFWMGLQFAWLAVIFWFLTFMTLRLIPMFSFGVSVAIYLFFFNVLASMWIIWHHVEKFVKTLYVPKMINLIV